MSNYQECTNCVMDSSDQEITFTTEGICNHCINYNLIKNQRTNYTEKAFEAIIEKIKKRGTAYPYDCMLALSGGTDSSYMMHLLKNFGLRVLAMHFDSSWNSEEANHNVKVLTEKMGVELYIYKANFEEFRELQVAYLKAGVIDLDVPTDHALHGAMYAVASLKKAPFIITGHNLETESVMPKSWVTDKLDSKNLLDIYKQYGSGKKLSTFPLQTLKVKFGNYNIRKIEMIFMLNYLKYNKQEASEMLEKTYGWAPVRVKHGESIWTRFYQCHILPTRFGVDKRRAHFSNLILSKVMTRNEAIEELKNVIYKDNFEDDKKNILTRYKITDEEFEGYMKQEIRHHSDFKNEKGIKNLYAKVKQLVPGLLKTSTRH
jgi:N-acetyl sugar amidotransferase